ncbi:uncharacterized protein K441DRAFT_588267, partial [Cenococcum geophilum 1.58]
VNNTLRKFLNIFITAYINNILIYLSSLSKYWKHTTPVKTQPSTTRNKISDPKYKFYASEVIYLGLIISHNGIKINPKKIAIIVN